MCWLASLPLASPVLAQEPRVRLEVERGPGAERCPGDDVLRELVVARLGRDPFDDGSPIVVRATLTRSGRSWEARIERFAADGAAAGARELAVPGRACDELAEALTLAIGIAVDPIALRELAPQEHEEEAPPAPEPVTTVEPPPVAPPTVSSPPRSAPAASEPPPGPAPALRLALRAGIAGLVAPEVNASAALSIGFALDALSIDLEARADAPSGAALPGGGAFESHFAGGASLVPCGHVGPLALCGLLTVGAFRVSADNRAVGQRVVPWAAGGGRVAGEIPLVGGWHAVVAGDLLVAFTPPTVALDGDEVWVASPVSLGLTAGIGASIR